MRTQVLVGLKLALLFLCTSIALPAAAAPNSAAGAHHHGLAHEQLKRLVSEEQQSHHDKKERERAMLELQDALRTLAANPELALEGVDEDEDAGSGGEHAEAIKRAFYSVQGKPRGKRTFYSVQGKPRGRRSVNEQEFAGAGEASNIADTAKVLRD